MTDERVSCKQVVDLLIDYIEQDLEADREALVERHLQDCPKCHTFVREYRKTSVLCRDELARNIPCDLQTRLVAALREQIDNE